jgi:hypothetical protein
MPAYSNLSTFIHSLKTGETNITKTLAMALAAEGVGPISEQSSVDPNLSDELKNIFAQYGMKPEEIAHIENEWTGELRNEVREWIVAANLASQSVTFSWELFAGDDPANRKEDPGAPNPVSVTFLSPRKGVKLSWLNYGQVDVDR